MSGRSLNLLDKTASPSKVIMLLAWPTIVEQILQTMVQYVDTAMVGSLGETATAAVAVNTSTIWLINGIMNAIGLGFSVQIARYIGAGKRDLARQTVRQAMLTILVGGGIITLFMHLIAGRMPYWLGADEAVIPGAISYMRFIASVYVFNIAMVVSSTILRCSGDTRTPMFFNMMTNVINVIGNFLLIFPTREVSFLGNSFTMWGAGMGVSGAALATAIATAFSGIALLRAIYKRESVIQISIKDDYRFNKAIMKETFRLGLPCALERMTISLGQIALTALIAGIGTTALAAHYLATTAESITYLPAFGFSAAATTLVAQSLGAGEKDMASTYGKLCTIYGTVVMTVAGALMFIFSHELVSIFTNETAVIAQGGAALRIEALAEPFFALSIVITGVLRGAGDTKWPFYISIVGMWVVRLTTAFVLVKIFHLGLIGAWIGMAVDLIVRGTLSLLRFRSGAWRHVWK